MLPTLGTWKFLPQTLVFHSGWQPSYDSELRGKDKVSLCSCINYTVCYFTGIFYAVVKQISMLFIDNYTINILYSIQTSIVFVDEGLLSKGGIFVF